MGRPASVAAARSEVPALLLRRLAGKRSARWRMIGLAGRAAERIYRRFQVGVHQWRLKHLVWYLTVELRDAAPTTRYDQWRAIRAVLLARGRDDLVERLERASNATYLRPTGVSGTLAVGRPLRTPAGPSKVTAGGR